MTEDDKELRLAIAEVRLDKANDALTALLDIEITAISLKSQMRALETSALGYSNQNFAAIDEIISYVKIRVPGAHNFLIKCQENLTQTKEIINNG